MTEWWIAPQTVGRDSRLPAERVRLFGRAAAGTQVRSRRRRTPRATVRSAPSSATTSVTSSTCSARSTTSTARCATGGRRTTRRASRHWPSRWSNQFSGYHPFPDVAIDGKLTQTENIADLAGLAAAFDAYRLTLGKQGQRQGVRAAAGPRVLHRLRAELSQQDERGRAAHAARDERSRARDVPRRDGSQPRCVVRRVRRAARASACTSSRGRG